MSALNHYQLTPANIRMVPNAPAVYMLRHTFSKKVYFGSTERLQTKLSWWQSRLQYVDSAGHIPLSMRLLLKMVGADPSAWTFAVLETGRPVNSRSKVNAAHLPWVRRAHDRIPHLLLNTYRDPQARASINQAPVRSRGVSPRAWLRGRLGLSGFVQPEHMPAHGWLANPTALLPPPDPACTFALYLLKSMERTTTTARSGVYNSTPAAIEELFLHWQSYHPADPGVQAAKPPRDVEEALYNVPVPASVRSQKQTYAAEPAPPVHTPQQVVDPAPQEAGEPIAPPSTSTSTNPSSGQDEPLLTPEDRDLLAGLGL